MIHDDTQSLPPSINSEKKEEDKHSFFLYSQHLSLFKPWPAKSFNSMAGLQYYFFPTDFLYPRPQSVNGNSSNKPVLPIQTQKRDGSDKVLQAHSSSPLVQAPIKKTTAASLKEQQIPLTSA